MQDVLIRLDKYGLYDLEIDGADFRSVDGFETAIPVSLFTDSRAPAVQVQNALRRRGWAGNILFADIDRELGSLLWILDQTRITEDTLNFARVFAQEGLQWLLEDNIARSVSVSVEQSGVRAILISVVITAIDNTVQRYVTLWQATDFSEVTTWA